MDYLSLWNGYGSRHGVRDEANDAAAAWFSAICSASTADDTGTGTSDARESGGSNKTAVGSARRQDRRRREGIDRR